MPTIRNKLKTVHLLRFASTLIWTLSVGISPVPVHSEVLEEIIVTGSRISREPADHVGPMSVIVSRCAGAVH